MMRLRLETDIGAIVENARAIRARVPANVKMLCVVKADAYGHGAVNVAQALQKEYLADAFAVATPYEGEALRTSGIDRPIVVLGAMCDSDDAMRSVLYGLSQAVTDVSDVTALSAASAALHKPASAHIKIDTGMSRIGITGREALCEVLDAFDANPAVRADGMFTHFCAAENDEAFTLLQKQRFEEARAYVLSRGFSPVCHAAASTAMLKPGFGFDMVRAGIALYGTGVEELSGILRPAQKLISSCVALRNLKKGETVGYGRRFTAQRDSVIMTVPCGYGDGYPRLLSGKADVLVHGKRAPITGNVCMDMLMADVTDIPEVRRGDEVVLLGTQGEETITPDELAEKAATIPYEIMLGFSTRVARTVKQETQNG